MNFGNIKQYMLFGGGELLVFVASHLKKEALSVVVVTSKRHSSETISLKSKDMSLVNWLKENDIECIISNDVSSDKAVIKRITNNTLGMSFGAAWIFKETFIGKFNGKIVNLHAARLPRNRGGGGFSWIVMQADKNGVSLIHQIDSGVDTGDIVMSEEFIYPPNCRLPSDYQQYTIKKYKSLLLKFFQNINKENKFNLVKQQEEISTYWPRLSTDIHGYINWKWELLDIENFICAFDSPYAGASTFINEKKVRIKKCSSITSDGKFHPFQNGMVIRVYQNKIFVAMKEGSLVVTNVLDEAGNNINDKIKVGDRFYTPNEYLERALQYRASYSPDGLSKSR